MFINFYFCWGINVLVNFIFFVYKFLLLLRYLFFYFHIKLDFFKTPLFILVCYLPVWTCSMPPGRTLPAIVRNMVYLEGLEGSFAPLRKWKNIPAIDRFYRMKLILAIHNRHTFGYMSLIPLIHSTHILLYQLYVCYTEQTHILL